MLTGKNLKRQIWLFSMLSVVALSIEAAQTTSPSSAVQHNTQVRAAPMQCVAFSPYVGRMNPDYGPHPSPELINQLLDTLVKETPFRCIMTYGVLNGLDATFAAAKARGIKVIAIIWIDKDVEVNSQSIAKGIEVVRAYSDIIVRLSCGSEVRTRHGNRFDGEIRRCIDAFREAGIKQPITTIDIWWEWCDRSSVCRQTAFAGIVDWVGINIFPWWENKHAGVFTCTPAEKAAVFHRDRIADIERVYPGKEVILTEFGWPNSPEGASEINVHSGEKCGLAGRVNQQMVVRSTFSMLAETGRSGVVFEAFSEGWKSNNEGQFGNAWGICQAEPPYSCLQNLLSNSE